MLQAILLRFSLGLALQQVSNSVEIHLIERPHWMCLRIEHMLMKNIDLGFGIEQQIDIFESLCQKEGFHLVIGWTTGIGNRLETSIA